MRRLALLSAGSFALGCLPLLAFALFSPGLRSDGFVGLGVFAFGFLTWLALIAATRFRRWFWALVALQTMLLALVLIETLSDAVLYLGT
jgi:hypothetical protein